MFAGVGDTEEYRGVGLSDRTKKVSNWLKRKHNAQTCR